MEEKRKRRRKRRAGPKLIRRRDGTHYWQIDFYDQDGRRVRECGGVTKAEALALLSRRKAEVKLGTFVNPTEAKRKAAEAAECDAAKAGPTVNEVLDWFDRVHVRHRTEKHFRPALRPWREMLGERRVKSLTKADVAALAAKRSETVGQQTLRHTLMAFQTCLDLAVEHDVLEVNHLGRLKKPPVPPGRVVYFTEEEFGKLLEAAPPWLRPLYRIAVAQGLRLGEVTGLRWQDVDLPGGLIYVNPDGCKTKRPDPIPLTQAGRAVLEEQRHRRAEIGRAGRELPLYVFTDDSGNHFHAASRSESDARVPSVRWGRPVEVPVDRNYLSKLTIRLCAAIGRREYSFHALRHTTASWMVQRGVDLTRVQRIMRHRDVQTTMRYAHLAPKHLESAVHAIDAAFGAAFGLEMDTCASGDDSPTPADVLNSSRS